MIIYDLVEENFFLVDEYKKKTLRITKKETLNRILQERWEKLNETEKIVVYENNFSIFKKDELSKIKNVKVIFNPSRNFGLYTENDENYFNTFVEPEWKNKIKKRKEKFDFKDYINNEKIKYIKLLLENLTRNDEKKIEYIINYLSFMVQNNFQKLPHSIIFFGSQGAGKGVLGNYIIKKLVGENQYLEISNQELESQFTEFLENKLFVVGNEIKDFSTKKSVLNKLKIWVSDPFINLNIKNIRSRVIKNTFNVMLFTNELIPLQIEDSDRRYTLIKTNNIKLLDYIAEKEKKSIDFSFLERELEKEFDYFIDLLYNYNYNKNLISRPLDTQEKELVRTQTELKYKLVNNYLTNNEKRKLNDILLEHTDDFDDDEFEDLFFKKYNLNLLEHILIKDLNNNLDREKTIKEFINKIFNRIENENIIFNNELKFILKILYRDKTESELNRYLQFVGEQGGIKQINKKKLRYRTIITNNTNNKNETEIETETENKDEIEKLKQENEKLKKEIEKLKRELNAYRDELELYKFNNQYKYKKNDFLQSVKVASEVTDDEIPI